MARTLLLIGGSGFFGKSFLDAFARGLLAPWAIGQVIVLSRGASGLRRSHPELLSSAVKLVDADIATAGAVPAADYVIHAASSADAACYAAEPLIERRNILAAWDGFASVARRTHRRARIVYCSSGAVYGRQPAELARIPESFAPVAADTLVAYKRDYAEAKLVAEGSVAALGRAGLTVSVARCFAFVGVYLPRETHFAIGNFLSDGLAGRPIEVRARASVVRSWMHADDLVRWLMTIAEAGSATCPTYNVGSGEALDVRQAARIVAARFGVEARTLPLDEPGEDRYVPDIGKARRELGLAVEHDLAASIDDMARRLAPLRRAA